MTMLITAWYNAGKDKLKFIGDIYMSEFTINEMKEMRNVGISIFKTVCFTRA